MYNKDGLLEKQWVGYSQPGHPSILSVMRWLARYICNSDDDPTIKISQSENDIYPI